MGLSQDTSVQAFHVALELLPHCSGGVRVMPRRIRKLDTKEQSAKVKILPGRQASASSEPISTTHAQGYVRNLRQAARNNSRLLFFVLGDIIDASKVASAPNNAKSRTLKRPVSSARHLRNHAVSESSRRAARYETSLVNSHEHPTTLIKDETRCRICTT